MYIVIVREEIDFESKLSFSQPTKTVKVCDDLEAATKTVNDIVEEYKQSEGFISDKTIRSNTILIKHDCAWYTVEIKLVE